MNIAASQTSFGDDLRLANLLGALALASHDDMVIAASNDMPSGVPAAAIALLDHAEWLTVAELAACMTLSHSATVRLVDRGCAAGFFSRRPSENDGRAVQIVLTEDGKAAASRISTARLSAISRFLKPLDEQERLLLSSMIERMLVGGLRDVMHGVRICRLCDPGVCRDCPMEPYLPSR